MKAVTAAVQERLTPNVPAIRERGVGTSGNEHCCKCNLGFHGQYHERGVVVGTYYWPEKEERDDVFLEPGSPSSGR